MSLDCIFKTLHYIEANYYKTISPQELENVSLYSYRNIQRIFKYACGETIGSYQQRLKIENAYKLILYSKTSFSDIAFSVGFESLAAFSKAFKLRFGVSPKEARQNKPNFLEKQGILPTYTEGGISYEKVYLPIQKVYFQSVFTHYENPIIEALWEKFMCLDFPNKGVEYFGVIADEELITDKIKCRYDACASVLPKKKDLPMKILFGGKYAKFLHHGSYATLEDTYKKIYGSWILTNELEFGISPIVEQYIKHDSNTAYEADFLTAILIPLQS